MLEEQKPFYDDLVTRVYNTLQEMINNGELKPGQKLVQEELAEHLGVSRTPLLMAVSRLVKDHLVETYPRRGTFVKRFTAEDLLDIYDIRTQLEPLGAYRAAEYIDQKDIEHLEYLLNKQKWLVKTGSELEYFREDYTFHLYIMNCSKNLYLYEILKTHNNIICNSERYLKSPEQSFTEHENLLQAFRLNDAESVKELMFYHVNGGGRAKLHNQIQSNGDVHGGMVPDGKN